MDERIIIKKFGPIDNIDIEIKKTVVFIGPQSSGKSTIAKVLSIFRSIDILVDGAINNCFQDYSLLNYFRGIDTYIEYQSPNYKVIYSNENWTVEKSSVFTEQLEKEKTRLRNLFATFIEEKYKDDTEEQKEDLKNQIYENNWKQFLLILKKQIYIPAERILTSIISESGFSFNQVSLPGNLKQFGRQFEIARTRVKELRIDALNVTFKYEEEGKEKGLRIYFDENNSLSLAESSSGVQALVPMQIVVESLTRTESGYSFIIEEPELNLFPSAQKSVLRFLIKKSNHKNDLIITTHSPYVLSVINNLLFANTVGTKNIKVSNEVEKIIPQDSWIDTNSFCAYYLEKGNAKNIFNNETKLVGDNELDSISEDISEERDKLFDILINHNYK